MKPIPDKLFFSIGEVSELTDVQPYVLRYWESEFRELQPSKSSGGQRTYRKKDIMLLLYIKRLLYEENYTIKGAKRKLREWRSQAEQLELNLKEEGYKTALINLRRQISELNEILK